MNEVITQEADIDPGHNGKAFPIKKIAFAFSLLTLQLLPVLYSSSYRVGLIVFLLMFGIGIPFSLVFARVSKMSPFCLCLAPASTIIITTVLGSFLIGFDIPIKYLPLGTVLLSVVTLVAFLFTNIKSNLNSKNILLEALVNGIQAMSVCATPVLFLSLLPILRLPMPSSTYRLGPDIVSYAKTTQFYLVGGLHSQAKKALLECAGMGAVEFNHFCDATMSWPPACNYRWGLASYQCFVAQLAQSEHAFETSYISMALCNASLSLVLLLILQLLKPKNRIYTIIGAIAICLNCNLIYIWTEGFQANFLAILIFTLILFVLIHQAEFATHSTAVDSKIFAIRNYIFLGICSLSVTLTYTECLLFILLPFLAAAWVLSLFFTSAFKFDGVKIGLSVGAGFLCAAPAGFLWEWILFTLRQLKEAGGNGYMQPHWANLPEILGLSNIYSNCTENLMGALIGRTSTSIIIGIALTLFIIYMVVKTWRFANPPLKIFGLASSIIILAILVFVKLKSPGNNYTYMKVYVFHIPIIFVFLLTSILSISDCVKKQSKILAHAALILILALALINGIKHITVYENECSHVTREQLSLQILSKIIDLENAFIIPQAISETTLHRHISKWNCIGAILPTRWFIQPLWFDINWLSKLGNRNVYILIEKGAPSSIAFPTPETIYEDDRFILKGTGITVSQINRK
jgi:hypothetical protein